jgi:peptidoglycan/LPS O-acetylase OafA/YrhL
MKCFQHREAEAVGTCKNCGRGLCSDCAAVGIALTCKGSCEAAWGETDRSLKRFRVRSKWALQAAAIVAFALAAFCFYLAGFTHAPHEVQALCIAIGVAFCLLTWLRVRQIRRWKSLNPVAEKADTGAR